MKNLKFIALSLLVIVGTLASGVKSVSANDFCPNARNLHGYWATFTPSTRLCTTSYKTYNTVSLAGEESWYSSDPIYVICNKGTPPFGPTYYSDIGSRAYIPSPDSSQTHHAHYYMWNSGSDFLMIGNVNQYNTFGWASLSTTTWVFTDVWKLSDWTGDSLYSKTVDLDAFSITNCP
jgi:hypothetical protein